MRNGIITAIVAVTIGVSTSAQTGSQAFCDNIAPGTTWDGYDCTKRVLTTNKTYGTLGRNAPTSRSRYKSSTSEPRSKDEIYTRCKQEWGSDYRMVEYCIKKQSTAKSAVVSRSNNGIKQRCQDEWGTDYRMVEYCIEKQTESRRNIEKMYR